MTSHAATDQTESTDAVARLHACLDTIASIDPDALPPVEQEALLRSLGRGEARISAIMLGVLGAAHRSDAAAATGAASTDQWAARAINADAAVLHRDVRLAQQLPGLTATREALAAGDLTPAHAEVILRADEQLPAWVTAEQRCAVERSLVDKAAALPPSMLRRIARRALGEIEPDELIVDAHENEVVVSEEEAARTRVRLTLHDNGDGTVSGHFTVPALHGELLRKVLQTMTAPRRGGLGASKAQVGDNTGLRTDWDRARGEAFCELLEHLPTDHLHPRTAATVVVTMTQDAIRAALKVAGLDTGTDLSAGEARRLVCNAGIIPAVLGGASVPLDLGRTSRLFSDGQRTAIGLSQKTCAASGCDRPFSWCELHHLHLWSEGGKTDLAEALGLCHFHHQRIHDARYVHRIGPEGVTFHRRT